jgi:hypothetical protein
MGDKTLILLERGRISPWDPSPLLTCTPRWAVTSTFIITFHCFLSREVPFQPSKTQQQCARRYSVVVGSTLKRPMWYPNHPHPTNNTSRLLGRCINFFRNWCRVQQRMGFLEAQARLEQLHRPKNQVGRNHCNRMWPPAGCP